MGFLLDIRELMSGFAKFQNSVCLKGNAVLVLQLLSTMYNNSKCIALGFVVFGESSPPTILNHSYVYLMGSRQLVDVKPTHGIYCVLLSFSSSFSFFYFFERRPTPLATPPTLPPFIPSLEK